MENYTEQLPFTPDKPILLDKTYWCMGGASLVSHFDGIRQQYTTKICVHKDF
jgi:hypothetical protein